MTRERMSWNEPKSTPLEDMVLIDRKERDRVYKDDLKERNRLRRRIRKLENLHMKWLDLETKLGEVMDDQEHDYVEEEIIRHMAVVRRALFR